MGRTRQPLSCTCLRCGTSMQSPGRGTGVATLTAIRPSTLRLLGCFFPGAILAESLLSQATELATATGQTTFVAPALASLSHALPAIPSPDAALMQRCFLAFTAAASSSPLPLAARASALLALSALSSATSRAAAASSGAPALQLAQTAIDSIAFLASFADAAAAACGCRCTPLAEALPDGGDPGAGARGLGDPIPAPDAAALLNAALSSVAAAVSATGCFSPASVDALRDLADTVLRSGLPFWDEGEGGGEDASLSLGTVEDSRRERLASGGAAAACAGFVELACACDLLRATEAGVAGPQAGCKGGALIRCCRVLLGQVRRAPGAPQLPRGVVARLLTCAAASASALVHSGTPVDLDVVAALASLSTSALCGGRWVPLAEQGRQKGAGEAREGDGTAGGPEEPSPLAGFLAPEHLPGDGQAVPALMGAEVQAAGATAAALLLAGSPRASSILPWASVGAGTSSTPSKDSAGDLRAPALARPLLQSLGAGPELQIARLLVAGLSGCVRGAPGIPDASRAERDIGAACASAPGVPSAVGALAHVCSCARGAVSAVAGVADDAPGGALGGVRGADERSFVHAALMHLSGLAERGPGSVAGAAASDHACDVLRACLEGLGSAQKVPSSSFGSLVSSVALELRARPALQTLCVEVLQRHWCVLQ